MDRFCAPSVHDRVKDLVDDCHGSLLDLGCGSGILGDELLPQFTITSADYSISRFKGSTKFVYTDLNVLPLPFRSRSFDVVLLIEVLEHLNNPVGVLDECYRILRPGGILILSSPNIENWESRLQFLFNGRLFSFREEDTSVDKALGMRHVLPLFSWALKGFIRDKFMIEDVVYNRFRIPFLNHNFSARSRLFGEIAVYRLRRR